jgi:hypothetical protein
MILKQEELVSQFCTDHCEHPRPWSFFNYRAGMLDDGEGNFPIELVKYYVPMSCQICHPQGSNMVQSQSSSLLSSSSVST